MGCCGGWYEHRSANSFAHTYCVYFYTLYRRHRVLVRNHQNLIRHNHGLTNMTLQLEQTIIEEQIEQAQSVVGCSTDEAFMHWSYSLFFESEDGEVPTDELIDGSQEKHVDIIHIEDYPDDSHAKIYIIQSKNTMGFSSNSMILISNGLRWIFQQPKQDYENLGNSPLVAKIKEIRELRKNYGASNLDVQVLFITKGDTQTLSQEYHQERDSMLNKWSSVNFQSFEVAEIGAKELVDRLNELEATTRKINEDIKVVYDVNRPSIIQFQSEGIRSFICTVPAYEIARVAGTEPKNAIFDKNVRRYLGLRGRVNSDIYYTCTNHETAQRFWFMNNGITMVCDKIDFTLDPDNPSIKVNNVQIINGCQTSLTLKQARDDGALCEEVYIQAKIFESTNQDFVNKIVLATNNQNSINHRDLYANDDKQILIQKIMEEQYQYYYERKANEFRDDKTIPKGRVVNNEKAAQAYLAIVKKKPTVARAQKYKIFTDEYYSELFEKAQVGHLLLAYLIYKLCADQGKIRSKTLDSSDLEHSVVTYGVFHVARVLGFLVFNSETWPKQGSSKLNEKIKQFSDANNEAVKLYEQARDIMVDVLSKNEDKFTSPNNYFKSHGIQSHINVALKTEDAAP